MRERRLQLVPETWIEPGAAASADGAMNGTDCADQGDGERRAKQHDAISYLAGLRRAIRRIQAEPANSARSSKRSCSQQTCGKRIWMTRNTAPAATLGDVFPEYDLERNAIR